MAVIPFSLRMFFSLGIAALIIGVPAWYQAARAKRYRNFRVVEEGVLYRSGQMSVADLERVIAKKGIKTIVNLRDGASAPDQREEEFCQQQGLKYVRIIQKPWSAADHSVPAEEGLRRFLEVMRDPANHPVLVHCFAGHHRTGAYCAIFRMEQGWSAAEAINEMYQLGYTTINDDWDIRYYLDHYPLRGLCRGQE